MRELAKGAWVESHKRLTSTTPPGPARSTLRLSLGDVSSEDLLGSGWHLGEANGRWTSGEAAEIFFSIAAPGIGSEKLQLELSGHPFRPGDRVTFMLNDSEPFAKTIGGADEVTEIAVPGPGTFHLSIAIEDPTSPQRLGQSDDRRVLGYWLSSLQLVAISPRTATDNV